LLAATLVLVAIWFGERAKAKSSLGFLAAAGLARETALVNVVALWRGPGAGSRNWIVNFTRAALVAVPLFAWMLYVHWKAGPAAQGFGNFTWPVVGWLEKWAEIFRGFAGHPNFRWLTTTTLLAFIALTVQGIFFARRLRLDNPWWRAGASGVAMLLLLGTSVWEGHPGAATRVLLPMSVAFAVFAARERANCAWIAAGSLSVFSGVLALWHVPEAPREIATGRISGGAYIAQIEEGWFGVERDHRRAWAWSEGRATVAVHVTPRVAREVNVRLKLRAITPREIEVRSGETVVWHGPLGEKLEAITFHAPLGADGMLRLQLSSGERPQRENANSNARALSFALYDVVVE
jgi:hypothetical protein